MYKINTVITKRKLLVTYIHFQQILFDQSSDVTFKNIESSKLILYNYAVIIVTIIRSSSVL